MEMSVVGARLYFLPVRMRVPLKFGTETCEHVTCARAAVTVTDGGGRRVTGWGETPLNVQWVWSSSSPSEPRHEALELFCRQLAEGIVEFGASGHPLQIGHGFQREVVEPGRLAFNERSAIEPMPYLAALLCCAPFDVALHDAYGRLAGKSVYQTYGPEQMAHDLSHYLEPAEDSHVSFEGKYPADYLIADAPARLRAWHLVGGLDPVDEDELTGDEPDDGYPVLLRDWIRRDGLKCLKIKLRGNDAAWDYQRLCRVGHMAIAERVDWLTADFNCTVTDPSYVNGILDRLRDEHPRIYGMLLYVEQPFAYDLERHRIDVRSVSSRKPLFMDESAHDWKYVRLGRSLGWSGVALKTCKTQTGALLSLCWARAHGMTLMVQDLTNPMLALIPHVLLAHHAGTIQGVEVNAMQFYPEASWVEAQVHPRLYRRSDGCIDLSTLRGPGFGYQLEKMSRDLGEPVCGFGEVE